jgi:hypothetical protein
MLEKYNINVPALVTMVDKVLARSVDKSTFSLAWKLTNKNFQNGSKINGEPQTMHNPMHISKL